MHPEPLPGTPERSLGVPVVHDSSTQRQKSGGRRRAWLLVPALTIGAALLWVATDTLRNSRGDLHALWLSYRIERYIEAQPEFSSSDRADLRAWRVVTGWDREKCRLAWGAPEGILTFSSLGTEMRHYRGKTRPAVLVFANGLLADFGL